MKAHTIASQPMVRGSVFAQVCPGESSASFMGAVLVLLILPNCATASHTPPLSSHYCWCLCSFVQVLNRFSHFPTGGRMINNVHSFQQPTRSSVQGRMLFCL